MEDENGRGTVEYVPGAAALVLVEFQRQWTDPGLYNRLVRRSLRRRNVVERARRTARAARKAGIAVVHAPLRIDPDRREGWLATLTLGRVFTEGTRKAEFKPGVHVEGDHVAEGRYTLNAFEGSNLAAILDALGAETLFVGGFTTDLCVAKSVTAATERDYDAYLLADVSATWSGFQQRRTERRFGSRTVNSRVIRERI